MKSLGEELHRPGPAGAAIPAHNLLGTVGKENHSQGHAQQERRPLLFFAKPFASIATSSADFKNWQPPADGHPTHATKSS
jgi:hypothetical protein